MALERLYIIDRISYNCRLSGKHFMMPFLSKLRWINSSPLLTKLIATIYVGCFFILLSDFFYILLLKQYFLWCQTILFCKLLYWEFWAWYPNNFSSLLLKLSGNFRHSLLRHLRENCFKKLIKISDSDERPWLIIFDRVLVSIKRSPYLSIHIRFISLTYV